MPLFRFESADRERLESRGLSRLQVRQIEWMVRSVHHMLIDWEGSDFAQALTIQDEDRRPLKKLEKNLRETLDLLSMLALGSRWRIDHESKAVYRRGLDDAEYGLTFLVGCVQREIAFSKPRRGRPPIPGAFWWQFNVLQPMANMGCTEETMVDVVYWGREPLLPEPLKDGDAKRQREQAHSIVTSWQKQQRTVRDGC